MALPAGRRKAANVTLLTSLVEGKTPILNQGAHKGGVKGLIKVGSWGSKAPPIFGTWKTSGLLTNAQSRFVSMVLDILDVLGPLHLARHTWHTL